MEHVPREPLLDVGRVLPILDKISIFGGLSETQLYRIFQQLKKVDYHANELIFHQGDHPSYIYIVLAGRVRLVFDVDDHPLSKTELDQGACFGETSLIGVQSHSASAVAIEDTELLVLSGETLSIFFEQDKTLFSMLILNIAREASRRLHQTDELLLHYLHEGHLHEVEPILDMGVEPGTRLAQNSGNSDQDVV